MTDNILDHVGSSREDYMAWQLKISFLMTLRN